MSKDMITKAITIEVTREAWKRLKIIGINREITIVQVISEILEKSVSKGKPESSDV